jgi:ribosome biogenesis GTPase
MGTHSSKVPPLSSDVSPQVVPQHLVPQHVDPQHTDLRALGWDAELAAAYAEQAGPAATPGRVVRVDRGRVHVLTGTGPVLATPAVAAPAPGPAPHDSEELCTGDWTVVTTHPDGRVTADARLPRRSALRRAVADSRSVGQALAANADTVALVEGLVPEPDLSRIERLLVLLWETGATPLVVLTKADLVPDAAVVAADVAAVAPGVEVLVVSSTTGEGYAALEPHVAYGRTLALVGRSGAGKSSLTNRLAGEEIQETQGIRGDGKGRHTTVRRELVLVPGGGAVIDTPGLRGAGLWAVDDGVEKVFADIEALAADCRFADCGHAGEPGCAVAAALEDGTLAHRRLESYRKLAREAEWIASRTDARLRAERTRSWKIIHKEMRRARPGRP